MVKTLPPAGRTSPTLAMRYSMRPSCGATSVLSSILTSNQFGVMLRRLQRVLAPRSTAMLGGELQRAGGVELLLALVEKFLGRSSRS